MVEKLELKLAKKRGVRGLLLLELHYKAKATRLRMDRLKYVEGFSSTEVVLRWSRVCSEKKIEGIFSPNFGKFFKKITNFFLVAN